MYIYISVTVIVEDEKEEVEFTWKRFILVCHAKCSSYAHTHTQHVTYAFKHHCCWNTWKLIVNLLLATSWCAELQNTVTH